MSRSTGITLEEHLALHAEADANQAAAAPAKNPFAGKQKSLPTELTLDSILDFGKHKGMQVEDMIYDQPGYLRWLVEKTDRKISANVIEKMKLEGII